MASTFHQQRLTCFPIFLTLTLPVCPLPFLFPGPPPDAPKPWRKQWQQEPWRNQLWHCITRSYLTSLWQFRQVVHLFCRLSSMKQECIPTSVASLQLPTFHSIRFRKKHKKRTVAPYSHQHLNWSQWAAQCTLWGAGNIQERKGMRVRCAWDWCKLAVLAASSSTISY